MYFLRKLLLALFPLFLFSCRSPTPTHIKQVCDHPEKSEKSTPIFFEAIKIKGSPSLNNYWNTMPVFTFCESSNITRSRARQGIEYWRRLGYPIEDVVYGIKDIDCMRSPRFGEVMIKLVTSDIPIGDNIAVTQIHYPSDTREILGVTIFVIGGFANYARLLEHELGHSLGWGHYRRDLHVMHPHYPKTGHDAAGLSYSVYQNKLEDIKFQN
jgi:hypothetical protein